LLKLEWVYEPDAITDIIDGGDHAAGIDYPVAADIAELQRLGRMGHVKAIEAKLDEIRSFRPNAAPFAARLRDLVHAFDFRRYMAALEEIDRHDP